MAALSTTSAPCMVDARVVRKSTLCREHVLVEVEAPQFPPSCPGQFVQLRCDAPGRAAASIVEWPSDQVPVLPDKHLAAVMPYLRRPFSIADRTDSFAGGVRLAFVSRTVGPGTRWLSQLCPDDTLNLIGPLGHGFRIPPSGMPLLLVGGGVGISPLLYLARHLHDLGRADVTLLFGATTRDLLPVRLTCEPSATGDAVPCVALPGGANYAAVLTSDDGSVGLRGVVTDGLRAWCAARGAVSRGSAPVLACGPDRMLSAVARLTRELNLPCQLCIERKMGCGCATSRSRRVGAGRSRARTVRFSIVMS